LVLASLIGLADDFLQIFAVGKWATDPIVLRFIKIGIIIALGVLIGWWFFFKLGVTGVYVPWYGMVNLGYLFIPFFIIVMLGVFSSSVIDGIDGLSGGVLASIFFAYTLISFSHNQIDLAAFCAVITGSILAFLWFNIPPARFYMGESGMIGLTVTISVIAFLTNTVLLVPIIAFPLFVTSLSVIIQMLSRKFRNGKKVFLFAPLHHHFEALGWPKYKVTMRYWIVGVMTAIIGFIISMIS
jgi:phospho-N-acetylmuramoyl-pentapeptide-transferase